MAVTQASRSTARDCHTDSARPTASWVLPDGPAQSGALAAGLAGDQRYRGPGHHRGLQAGHRLRPGDETVRQRRDQARPDRPRHAPRLAPGRPGRMRRAISGR